MSQSDWRHQLALRGCLIVGLLFAPAALGQPQEQVGGPNAEQPAPEESEPKFPAFGEREHGRAKTYRAICKGPYNREYADLCQQWRVAQAAEKQLIATWVSNGALILTLILSGLATGAAYKAIRQGKETAAHELRAYIDIKSGGFHLGPPHHGRLRVRVAFSNFGQTPARDVRFWIKMNLFEPGTFTFVEADKPGVEQGIISPGNTAVAFAAIPVDDDIAFDAIREGDMVPLVWGRVTYRDIFDERDHTFEFTAKNGIHSTVEEGKNKGQHAWMLLPAEGGYKST